MGDNEKIIVTRSGRRAKQLHFLYKSKRSRKPNKSVKMDHGQQAGEQQHQNEIARQLQEIANEQERLRQLREELE